MNNVVLSGRLTKDPEVKYTRDGKCVAKYTLAVEKEWIRNTQTSDADFIRITAFEKSGEFAEKYLKKGMKIIVQGRINTGSYKDQDGKTVYTTEVVVNKQEFCESKKSQQSNYSEPNAYDDFENADDDLPFA